MSIDLLIDTANIYARSVFKLGYLKTSRGEASGGLYGTIRSLKALDERFKPDRVVLVLEQGGRDVRQAIDHQYKANRPKEGLFGPGHYDALLTWALRHGYYLGSAPQSEADDVIAALARQNNSVIASTDHDFWQLLRGNEVVCCADISKQPFTEQDLFQSLQVKPDDYWKLRALSGDKSDNIAGIARVGEKTASKIGCENDWDWEKMLRDPRVEPHQERVLLNAKLVQFLPVEPILQNEELDREWLERFYQEWEFKSFSA